MEHWPESALAEPFCDDVFGAPSNLHAVMDRMPVDRTVGVQIVPDHGHALFRHESLFEPSEPGPAAGLDIVEIDHECPGALAAVLAMNLEVATARLEEVAMRLVFLAGRVFLRLRGVGIRPVDAKGVCDALVNLVDQGLTHQANIGGFAGADLRVGKGIDCGRGAQPFLDEFDEAVADFRRQEVLPGEHLRLAGCDTFDIWVAIRAPGDRRACDGLMVRQAGRRRAVIGRTHHFRDPHLLKSPASQFLAHALGHDTAAKLQSGKVSPVGI